jgi:hypothetical protein
MGDLIAFDRRRRRQARGIKPLRWPRFPRARRWRVSARGPRFALLLAIAAAMVAVALLS